MFWVAVILFLGVYSAVATASAWCFYRLSRGYEAAPPLAGAALWKRSAIAGGAAIGVIIFLALVKVIALRVLGSNWAERIDWVLILLELFAWTLYCVWICELDNPLEGVLYALLWMIVLHAVLFLVFWPFGVPVRLLWGPASA